MQKADSAWKPTTPQKKNGLNYLTDRIPKPGPNFQPTLLSTPFSKFLYVHVLLTFRKNLPPMVSFVTKHLISNEIN